MFYMTFARYAVRVGASASSKLTPGLCWRNASKTVRTTIFENYNSLGTFDSANFKQHNVIIYKSINNFVFHMTLKSHYINYEYLRCLKFNRKDGERLNIQYESHTQLFVHIIFFGNKPVNSFIVASCVIESIYCSLTNKCTFY